MTNPFETPEQQSKRLDSEARWAFGALIVIVLVGIYLGIAALARAWVWIKWAFA